MDNRTEDLPSAEALTGDAEQLLRVVEDDQGAKAEAGRPADGTKKRSSSKHSVRRRQRKPRGRRSQPPALASTGSRRASRPFPAATFEDALELALAIQRISGGAKVRRLTLFEQLDKSPESGPSRQMITNSARYGLTTGSYKAEYLELTQLGRAATSTEGSARERLQARFELSINEIPPFQLLYETLKDRRIPTHAVMRDVLAEAGYSPDLLQEAVETFIVNAKFIGLLRTIAGSERLISIEQLLDEVPASAARTFVSASPEVPLDSSGAVGAVDWSTTCFYVAPIGEVESEIRQHSDVILAALVEPALTELGLKVVRADGIESPGVITKQVIEHIAKAKLVVADLSFHNPNVFYELALRHATGKPTIHLIRNSDRIPFDIDQFRTIRIDTSDLYAFVPQIETYRAEIATHARRALDETGEAANPLFVFYPEFRSVLEAA
jgi:hypothetical protein